MVSQAGRLGFPAAGLLAGASFPSREGGLDPSLPLLGGLVTGATLLALSPAPGPTLFDNPALATRLLAAAIGLFAPGPTVDDNCRDEALRPMVGTGLEAGSFGAAALSAKVIRFAAGGLRPVFAGDSANLRLAPPRLLVGATSWDVVNGSSGIGGGPKIDGRLRIGEPMGEAGVVVRMILGDLSARGSLPGEDTIFDGCGSRENYHRVSTRVLTGKKVDLRFCPVLREGETPCSGAWWSRLVVMFTPVSRLSGVI